MCIYPPMLHAPSLKKSNEFLVISVYEVVGAYLTQTVKCNAILTEYEPEASLEMVTARAEYRWCQPRAQRGD